MFGGDNIAMKGELFIDVCKSQNVRQGRYESSGFALEQASESLGEFVKNTGCWAHPQSF